MTILSPPCAHWFSEGLVEMAPLCLDLWFSEGAWRPLLASEGMTPAIRPPSGFIRYRNAQYWRGFEGSGSAKQRGSQRQRNVVERILPLRNENYDLEGGHSDQPFEIAQHAPPRYDTSALGGACTPGVAARPARQTAGFFACDGPIRPRERPRRTHLTATKNRHAGGLIRMR